MEKSERKWRERVKENRKCTYGKRIKKGISTYTRERNKMGKLHAKDNRMGRWKTKQIATCPHESEGKWNG